MIISFVSHCIRFTCLYQYVLLTEKLRKKDVYFEMILPSSAINYLNELVSKFKDDEIYSNYCEKISKINIFTIKNPKKDEELRSHLKKSNLVFFGAEKNVKLNIPEDPNILKKSFLFKSRVCNDLSIPSAFYKYSFLGFMIPSPIFDNHESISIFRDKVTKKIPSYYVIPPGICNNSNPFLSLNQKYFVSKYNLDPQKKTLAYYISDIDDVIYEKEIILKLFSKEMVKEYNVLFINKPFSHAAFMPRTLDIIHEGYGIQRDKIDEIFDSCHFIDYFDYDPLMRSGLINGIVSGISTAVRECLLYKIPVLFVEYGRKYPSDLQKKMVEYDVFLKDRFRNKKISSRLDYEGIRVNISDDWRSPLQKIMVSKYDYAKKSNIWFLPKRSFLDVIIQYLKHQK